MRRIVSPLYTYVHDFFATERHVIFNLHAVSFAPARFLAGLRSFTECLSWQPEQGNLILIAEKEGDAPPLVLEAPAAWMWHSLNAYEHGGEIVADFVGYDAPDHFLGEDALFRTLMRGETGRADVPGTLRRYRIDLAAGTLREEILDPGAHEFPIIDPRLTGRAHDRGYFSCRVECESPVLHDGVVAIELGSGRRDEFGFGAGVFVGEPLFVPQPDGAEDQGWLLVEGQDGRRDRGFLAVFDAGRVAEGPCATVHLEHHAPLGFHGTWLAAAAA